MADIKKIIFCANEQVETEHVLSVSPSGEIIATCSVCGRFLKFPAGVTRAEFDMQVAEHKTSNEGQVSVEEMEKNLSELGD